MARAGSGSGYGQDGRDADGRTVLHNEILNVINAVHEMYVQPMPDSAFTSERVKGQILPARDMLNARYHIQQFRQLLNAAEDINVTDSKGLTPLDYIVKGVGAFHDENNETPKHWQQHARLHLLETLLGCEKSSLLETDHLKTRKLKMFGEECCKVKYDGGPRDNGMSRMPPVKYRSLEPMSPMEAVLNEFIKNKGLYANRQGSQQQVDRRLAAWQQEHPLPGDLMQQAEQVVEQWRQGDPLRQEEGRVKPGRRQTSRQGDEEQKEGHVEPGRRQQPAKTANGVGRERPLDRDGMTRTERRKMQLEEKGGRTM